MQRAKDGVHVVDGLHDVDLARGRPGAIGAASAAVGGGVAGQHPEGRPDALPACVGASQLYGYR